MDSAITPENVIIPTKGELVLLLVDVSDPSTLSFLPKWQSLLETYADRGYNTIPSLSLSSIDCSPLPDLCRSVFNVVSFPTINLYRDGQLVSTLRENVFVDVLLVLGKARYNAWKNITETPPTPPTSLQSYTVTISPPPSHSQDWNPSLHHNFTFPQFKNFSESLNLKITHTPLTTLPRLLSTSKTPIILFFGASFCPHTLVFNEPWLSLQTALVTNPLHSPPVTLSKVECANSQKECWHYMGDDGFPTVVLFYRGLYIQELKDHSKLDEFVRGAGEVIKSVEVGWRVEKYEGQEFLEEGSVKIVGRWKFEKIDRRGSSSTRYIEVSEVSVVGVLCIFVVFAVFVMKRRRGWRRMYTPVTLLLTIR